MYKNCLKLKGICAITSMIILLSTGAAYAKKIFKVQVVYPKASSVATNAVFFSDKVKELTNGEVEIQLYDEGTLVKAKEGLNAMKHGMIDGYIGSMLYFAGKIPEVNGQWLPFSWRSTQEAMEIYYKHGYLEIMREATLKQDCYYVAPISVAKMGFMTNFPINTTDDLKGKLIRAVGMEGQIVQALGGSAVSIDGAEQYTALQRGTVDGTDYPWYTLRDYKFYEVLKYVSSPTLHSPGMVEIILSNNSFEKLSTEEKQAINKAGYLTSMYSADLDKKNDEEIIGFIKEKGVSIVELPETEVYKMVTSLKPIYDKHAKENELCAKQVQALKKYFETSKDKHPLF